MPKHQKKYKIKAKQKKQRVFRKSNLFIETTGANEGMMLKRTIKDKKIEINFSNEDDYNDDNNHNSNNKTIVLNKISIKTTEPNEDILKNNKMK